MTSPDPYAPSDPYGGSYGQPAGQPGYGQPVVQQGPIGKVRSTWSVIGLTIITLGIYSLVWYYKTHEEMKQHTGQGIGGGIALVIALLVGIVSPFLISDEVGKLYSRRGQRPPVTALTGLWVFPGAFLLVLPLVWLFQTNGALNDYWRSVGAR